MKFIVLCFLTTLFPPATAQTSIVNVTENTLKVAGMSEEIFYYGFAEGDQLIFNFREVDNKELKEVEIIEYPSNSRFMEYKTKSIENKTIAILKTGVYAFRLKNSNLFGRICKIKIDRIPATDKTKTFNAAVKWIEKPDTSWNIYTKYALVGYDTLLTHITKKELVKTEVSEDLFMIKKEPVHSQLNSNGNKVSIPFSIPAYPSTQFVKKKITTLVYWVGVGDRADRQWDKYTGFIKGLVKTVAAYYVSPLGAYAVGALTDFEAFSTNEDVYYALVDGQNKNLFYNGDIFHSYDSGQGTESFSKITNPVLLSGNWYIILLNDNKIQGLNVTVKMSVMVQTDYYEEKPYTEQKITPRYENKIFKEPVITVHKMPVIIN